MAIFVTGIGLFLLGTILNAIEWWLHRKQAFEAPLVSSDWLLETIRNWFGLLTGPDSSPGQRLAAFGDIRLVVAVIALIAWAT
jgi:hypothetical protein